jgi:DNA-binding XRE family transcriptional regulator
MMPKESGEEKVEPEFITITTGWPISKYRYSKTIRNPKYIKPKSQPEDIIAQFPDLINVLITLRKGRYLTQQDLARVLKTSQAAISRLENGHANPTLEQLIRLTKFYGKTLNITVK